MKKLIVFDVDGVLLDNKIGAFKEILIILDKERDVRRIDEEYQRRKHLGPWGLEELAKLYEGFSKDKLKGLALRYCLKNLMKGAEETIAELKEQSYLVGAISSNPQFILETLSEILTLDLFRGTELEFKGNIATGRIVKKVDRYVKAQILKEKMAEFNLSKERVIVVGDSLTDLPIAELSSFFIAFNAKKEVLEKADAVVSEKDLRLILKYLSET